MITFTATEINRMKTLPDMYLYDDYMKRYKDKGYCFNKARLLKGDIKGAYSTHYTNFQVNSDRYCYALAIYKGEIIHDAKKTAIYLQEHTQLKNLPITQQHNSIERLVTFYNSIKKYTGDKMSEKDLKREYFK